MAILKKCSLISIFIVIFLVCPFFSNGHISYAMSTSNIISADEFVATMKTGWNLGNSLDSHHGSPSGDGNLSQETIWGNPKVTKELIDYVHSQGFDVIRIPISWYTHTYRDKEGQLHIHPDWLKRVEEVIDYCISARFYVIINTHHDGKIIHTGVADNSFAQVKTDAISLWKEIATYYSSYDQHLIFESYNEIDNLESPQTYGERASRQMNELNQIFVDTVRSTGGNNSNRLLMVPTLLDKSSSKYMDSFILPIDSSPGKLIVTVHKYSKQFDQNIEPVFADLESFSNKISAPIIIGEWGTKNSFSPSQFRSVHAANFIARASSHGLKCIYWDNGSDYSIIDRNKLVSNSEMISAIMSPVAYNSRDNITLDSWNDYLYMTIDQKSGALKEDNSWGSIVVNADGNGGYPLDQEKSSIYIGLYTGSSMEKQKIHYVYFFDENNSLLSFVNKSNGFSEKTIEIPSGASYVRIGINNSYSKTSLSEYEEAFEKDDLSVVISFY